MSIKKKILLTIAFVLATLVVPAVVLLLFVDALNYFAVYVVAFGLILFGILGFIVISLIDIQSTLKKTVEELKMQNAAIAYKLTNTTAEMNVDAVAPAIEKAEAPQASSDLKNANLNPVANTTKVNLNPATDTTKVNLNPADPLVMPVAKKQAPVVEKKSDDGFDDFQ